MIVCKPAFLYGGDELVWNVRREMRDGKSWASFNVSRTSGFKGVRVNIIDIQIIMIMLTTP